MLKPLLLLQLGNKSKANEAGWAEYGRNLDPEMPIPPLCQLQVIPLDPCLYPWPYFLRQRNGMGHEEKCTYGENGTADQCCPRELGILNMTHTSWAPGSSLSLGVAALQTDEPM